jgi:hypothetical protein
VTLTNWVSRRSGGWFLPEAELIYATGAERVSFACGCPMPHHLVVHLESILCMILSAKITASAMIELRAGDGLVLSNRQSSRAARIAAMTPMTRLRPSSMLDKIRLRFVFAHTLRFLGCQRAAKEVDSHG